MLNTNRSLTKFILLSIITLGIYWIVVISQISNEINLIASKRDGKHTMHYLLIFFIFSWLTLGIAPLVWGHRLTARIGDELRARNIPYNFEIIDFWCWYFLGSAIVVGPFIYAYKLLHSMNFLCDSYNKEMMSTGQFASYSVSY